MKEDKKIGYSALVVGAISLWEAWRHIMDGQGNFLEIFFLSLGLVASLLGIALILQRNNSTGEG